jgi:hypothetical protein
MTDREARLRSSGSRTIADQLRLGRHRRFVGRAAEVELFQSALDTQGAVFTVLFLHGPGGVGKSTLLRKLADTAVQAGVTPICLDARVIEPSPAGLLAALRSALGVGDDVSPVQALSTRGRTVVQLDTFELLAALEDWLRDEFLPLLSADILVVIAGRNPPSPGWVSDPGWRDLLRVVSLRNLRPEDTRDYLRVEGVSKALHDQVLTMTHGHPLTLSLLVDAISRHGDDKPVPRALVEAPDIVRTLIGQIVDAAPTPRHLAALEVCAHVRLTTEYLLRSVLDGADTRDLFAWLRTLSFVEEGPDGLLPHDVARDVLDADLRWRDEAGYAHLHRRIRSHLLDRVVRAAPDVREQQRRITDVIFLIRHHPIAGAYWDWAALGRASIEELRPDDTDQVLSLTRDRQGAEQAELVAYWLDRQPGAFRAFRDRAGELIGYAAYLALHEASDADLAADPGRGRCGTTRSGKARPGRTSR